MRKDRARGLSPAKAGEIYGKFTPSPAKKVKVLKAGGIITEITMTREERRRRVHSGL